MRRLGWWVIVLLASLIGAYGVANAVVPGVRTSFVADLFSARAARSFGHLAFGGVALVAGALQFSTRLRFERPVVHQRVGTLYVVTVLVSGVSAALMAPVSTGGLAAHFGFGMLAVLWIATTTIAYVTARRRAYNRHRVWMIRSYALCSQPSPSGCICPSRARPACRSSPRTRRSPGSAGSRIS
jgi:hypothetical protein